MPEFIQPPPPAHLAGIDVAADALELCLLTPDGQPLLRRSFTNTPAGIRALLRPLAQLDGAVRACLEPTSRYHERLVRALANLAHCTVQLANPRQVHDFAKSLGRRAKTDRADALLLAQLAACLPQPAYQPPPQLYCDLRAIVDRMNALTRQATREKNRQRLIARCGAPPCVRNDLQASLNLLERGGEALQQEAIKLLGQDPQLKRRFQLLKTIVGVADKAGLQLLAALCLLPPHLAKRQWVAYAGLDPQAQDSGTSVKPRRISRKGSPALRLALMMPAQVAIRNCPPLTAYNQRLLDRGKKPMQAVVAVMAKLLHIIWAMWRSDQPFDPTKICAA